MLSSKNSLDVLGMLIFLLNFYFKSKLSSFKFNQSAIYDKIIEYQAFPKIKLSYIGLILPEYASTNSNSLLLKSFKELTKEENLSKEQYLICQILSAINRSLTAYLKDKNAMKLFESFLSSCIIQEKYPSIVIEALKLIFTPSNVTFSWNLYRKCFEILQKMLLNSNKAVIFSALKLLNQIADKYSSNIAIEIFLDLENIVEGDQHNSSFKNIAFSIFLKISKELSNHRLNKMLSYISKAYI